MAKTRLGLILGLLGGTALGVLFAPKKGKEIREKIKKEYEKGDYNFDVVKNTFKSFADDVVKTCKEAINPAVEEIKKHMQEETKSPAKKRMPSQKAPTKAKKTSKPKKATKRKTDRS